MATVFDNSMVAHVWASQKQDSGRSHNGNFYFNGRSIWSYGSHFCVGYIVPADPERGRDSPVALLSSDRHSISTSQHQANARSAVSHMESFGLPALEEIARVNLDGILIGRPSPDMARYHKEAIIRYVKAYATKLNDGSALFLLGLIGRGKSWNKIKAKAEKKAKGEREELKRRETERNRMDAKRLSDLLKDDGAFQDWMDEQENRREWGSYPSPFGGTTYRNATPSESLGEAAKRLFRAQKSVKGVRGHKRVFDTLTKRLKETRARVRYLRTWENKGIALANFRRNKEAFRRLLPLLERGDMSRQEAIALRDCLRYVGNSRPGLLSDQSKERLRDIFNRVEQAHSRAVERENKARMDREREARESWLSGATGPLYGRLSDARGGALLRAKDVERDGSGKVTAGTLQTSHGASVPLVHALRAFAFVRRVVSTGEGWSANGHQIRVGHFRVDRIAADGTMTAGCHTIHYPEMERLAAELGASDIFPDDSVLESSKGVA